MTREDAGPFLILGVDKDADDATIETQLRSRLEAARRGEIKWTESDINWAYGVLTHRDQRVVADAESWNADLASGDVRRLTRLYRTDSVVPGWEPLDPEPPSELPEPNFDLSEFIASLSEPSLPLELPAVDAWLERFAVIGTDPWGPDVLGS